MGDKQKGFDTSRIIMYSTKESAERYTQAHVEPVIPDELYDGEPVPSICAERVNKRKPRYKLYKIDTETVLAMLNWNTYDAVILPVTTGLPDGYQIEAINYNIEYNCFMARVYHESFDVVANGVMIPISDDLMGIEQRVVYVWQYIAACDGAGIVWGE